MKSSNRHNPAIAVIGTWWLSNVIIPAKAFHTALLRYATSATAFRTQQQWSGTMQRICFLAVRELLSTSGGQWERIMHLPRRLAGPIGICCQTPLHCRSRQPCCHAIARLLIRFHLQMQHEERSALLILGQQLVLVGS
ncbi:MAG TPA: hypothetical protein VGN44_13140 [Candidatus Angelobacter sp.]|jgi:hypothetical protein